MRRGRPRKVAANDGESDWTCLQARLAASTATRHLHLAAPVCASTRAPRLGIDSDSMD